MFIFARNLQKLRKKAKLTQSQLAEKLGVTRARVGAWEQGRTSPDMERLAKICDTLGVWDMQQLLKRQEPQKNAG